MGGTRGRVRWQLPAALLTLLVLATGTPAAQAQTSPSVPLARIAGGNRIETAILLSQAAWGSPPVNAVLIARLDTFPDALAAGPLAGQLGAPILLTPSDTLPQVVITEIRRLAPETIYVLGGEGAISAEVATALARLAGTVQRLAGLNRYDTARVIANRTTGNSAAIASGLNFPDALSASSLAPSDVLLTQRDRLSFDPAGLGRMTIVGGTEMIADGIVAAPRLAGSNRYQTNLAVLQEAMRRRSGNLQLFVTTGEDFPDALAAAALTQPILLVDPSWTQLPAGVAAFLETHRQRFTAAFILGGEAAVPTPVQQAVAAALNSPGTPAEADARGDAQPPSDPAEPPAPEEPAEPPEAGEGDAPEPETPDEPAEPAPEEPGPPSGSGPPDHAGPAGGSGPPGEQPRS